MPSVGELDTVGDQVIQHYAETSIVDLDKVIIDFVLDFDVIVYFSDANVVFEEVKYVI